MRRISLYFKPGFTGDLHMCQQFTFDVVIIGSGSDQACFDIGFPSLLKGAVL